MGKNNPQTADCDNWQCLSQFTSARIALGRAGMSLPTKANLEFQLAHALARDAANLPLDFPRLEQSINNLAYQTLTLQSLAENHAMYLQRPDLGRLLNSHSIASLNQQKQTQVDAVIVIADGLSSAAIDHHAAPFLGLLLPSLVELNYRMPSVCLVKYGRVAIGDPIAEHYAARLCIVLIGERPGLSSPDSMGIYFTYLAKSGISTDADRNCISNIHNNGLSYEQALNKLLFLIKGAERLRLSGVHLKDETTENKINSLPEPANFLLEE
jgi:ethanolamine ammonia-lyase small subunit